MFSHGFICPKAFRPQATPRGPRPADDAARAARRQLAEASWDEAFEEIDARLSPILEQHGRDAVAVYVGNPNAHNLSALTYGPVLLRALGTQNVYTASTVDQMPKHVSAGRCSGRRCRSRCPTSTAPTTC